MLDAELRAALAPLIGAGMVTRRTSGELAPRRVLELLREGKEDDVRAQLPRHAQKRFDEIADGLVGEIYDLQTRANDLMRFFGVHLEESRKAFALAIKEQPPAVKAGAFTLADGRDTWQMACDMVRKTLRVDE